MAGLLERGVLIVLIALPMWLARRPAKSVVRIMMIAMPVAWFLLVYVAPHFPQ